jgi:hypothetical protein
MNDRRESDSRVVPAKPANKAAEAAAEPVEERRLDEGNTGQQNARRTQSRESASRALERVRQVAAKDRDARFTALLHHVDVERLRGAYRALCPRAAAGVDGETWESYGQDLEARLQDLHARVQRGAYRAKPSRRAYIPKTDGRLRPLGIAALEDKIVQRAVVEVLNAIYEADFLGFSYGFRPGRGPHDALDALTVAIENTKVNWVLDADFRDFLESSSHCLRVHGGGVEQAGIGVWEQYSQAFSLSVADVEGLKVAALDTLQHGLAADAEGAHRVDDRDVAGWSVFDE